MNRQFRLSKGATMTVVVRLTSREEAKALPILLRHSPGMVLPERTYVLHHQAVAALRAAGVRFTELSRESNVPTPAGAIAGVDDQRRR
jgi:hypothetical protein